MGCSIGQRRCRTQLSIQPPCLQEYVPENLESLVGFDPPPSPPSRCGSRGGQGSAAQSQCCARWSIVQRDVSKQRLALLRCLVFVCGAPLSTSFPSLFLLWSRACSYASPPPASEDFLKEPPVMPPQLQLSLLNVPPAMDAIAALPRPQHVILNHIYLQRMTTSTAAMVVGTTHRYRSKYVTTVM